MQIVIILSIVLAEREGSSRYPAMLSFRATSDSVVESMNVVISYLIVDPSTLYPLG